MDAVNAPHQVFSDPSPGRDLDQTGELLALEHAAQEPDEPSINGIVAVDSRDWREIAKRCDALLKESKDLRVAVLRSRALLITQGLLPLCQSIALIHELVARFWIDLYPRLDEDDNDPTTRINVIQELGNPHMLSAVRAAVIASLRGVGPITLHDYLVAKGFAKARAGASTPPSQHVAQALTEGCLPGLRPAVQTAIDQLSAIDSAIARHVGDAFACDTSPLRELLVRVAQGIDEHAPNTAASDGHGTTNGISESNGVSTNDALSNAQGTRMTLAQDLSSREDVLRVLDKISQYYERYEPSSPVPLLIDRAKRLVPMNFRDIIKDLADKGLPQIEAIVGAATK
ncbi:MAG: hypothetical protein JWN04_4163 [Myxococcaceae bacterium]|nr:hypothetical protein [Myxococcaceae bacterium]